MLTCFAPDSLRNSGGKDSAALGDVPVPGEPFACGAYVPFAHGAYVPITCSAHKPSSMMVTETIRHVTERGRERQNKS